LIYNESIKKSSNCYSEIPLEVKLTTSNRRHHEFDTIDTLVVGLNNYQNELN